MSKREFVDFATVRNLLLDARERRGELSYEQKVALQHAEWAASENRGGIKTSPEVFTNLFEDLTKTEKLNQHPENPKKRLGGRVVLSPLNPEAVFKCKSFLSVAGCLWQFTRPK